MVAGGDLFGLVIREMLSAGIAKDLVEPFELRERLPSTVCLLTKAGSTRPGHVGALEFIRK